MLSESLIIHEQIDDVAFGSLEPLGKLLCSEWPAAPALVGEAECYVITEGIVAEKKFQLRLQGVVVDEIGTLPADDVTGSFSKHRLEAKLVDLLADFVGVDQLRVPEGYRSDPEMAFYGHLVLAHLMLELLEVDSKR